MRIMPPTPAPSSPPAEEVRGDLRAAYSVLAARYQSASTLVWNMPALAMTAQSFLIAAALGQGHTTSVRLGFTVAIAAVGIGTLLLMYKLDQSANADRRMLDHYEEILLPDNLAPLRLEHFATIDERDDNFRARLNQPKQSDVRRVRFMMAMTYKWRPALIWLAIELVVTTVGCVAPWLPSSPSSTASAPRTRAFHALPHPHTTVVSATQIRLDGNGGPAQHTPRGQYGA